jgi:hypothetical protein
VELDEVRDAFVVHQLAGVDARARHFAVVRRDAPWAVDPRDDVERFGRIGNEAVETPGFQLGWGEPFYRRDEAPGAQYASLLSWRFRISDPSL